MNFTSSRTFQSRPGAGDTPRSSRQRTRTCTSEPLQKPVTLMPEQESPLQENPHFPVFYLFFPPFGFQVIAFECLRFAGKQSNVPPLLQQQGFLLSPTRECPRTELVPGGRASPPGEAGESFLIHLAPAVCHSPLPSQLSQVSLGESREPCLFFLIGDKLSSYMVI